VGKEVVDITNSHPDLQETAAAESKEVHNLFGNFLKIIQPELLGQVLKVIQSQGIPLTSGTSQFPSITPSPCKSYLYIFITPGILLF
jgi:hypothetical protein